MDYEDIVRLNVLKTAGVECKFSWLDTAEQRQVDAAITIVRKGFDPDFIRGLERRTVLGFYVLHAMRTDPNCPDKQIYRKLAVTHLGCSDFMTMPAYQAMLAKTVNELMEVKMSAQEFITELVSKTPASHAKVTELLGVGSSYARKKAEGEEVVQGLVIKTLLSLEGGKDLMVKHVSKTELGRLVLKHNLSGFERHISRKDAGTLLSDQLGV